MSGAHIVQGVTAIVCSHPLDAASGRLCGHLMADDDLDYILRFTGRGIERELVCPDCRDAPSDSLVQVCAECLEERAWSVFSTVGLVGSPQVLTRLTSLRFDHRELILPALANAPLHTIAPLIDHESDPRSLWLGVTRQSELVRIDLDAGTVEQLGQSPVHVADGPIALVPSPCGRFAALVSQRGRHGAVFDLAAGGVSMTLDRGDYCVSVSDFSLAFVRDRERTLVVHATDWNRLDVSDPATSERLTARTTPSDPEDPHYLNYFHAGLTISPDQRWLIDDGWVWHPVGVLRSVDLHRWIHENVWETENGPSLATLREVSYFWDGPRCFSPDGQLIVGGFGPDDELMVDAALIFDPASGELRRWFAGPPQKGSFVFDQWLFASAQQHGTSVWDIATGERVCHDPGLVPAAYHPRVRSFVTLTDEPGRVLVSALVSGP